MLVVICCDVVVQRIKESMSFKTEFFYFANNKVLIVSWQTVCFIHIDWHIYYSITVLLVWLQLLLNKDVLNYLVSSGLWFSDKLLLTTGDGTFVANNLQMLHLLPSS